MGPCVCLFIPRTTEITQKRKLNQTVLVSPAKWWINVHLSGYGNQSETGIKTELAGQDDGRSSLAPAAASAQEPCCGAKRHMHSPHATSCSPES